MEYFTKRLYDLRQECKDYIKLSMEKLADENGNYNFVDQQVVDDMDTDVLIECPVTTMEGRHGDMHYYNIYKLELNKEGSVWLHGIELEISDDYVFSDSEVDSECLVDVASRFQTINEKDNG